MENYFTTNEVTKTISTGFFEKEQNELIRAFDNETESLVEVCRDMTPHKLKAKKDVTKI
jgi:hypothetical protein